MNNKKGITLLSLVISIILLLILIAISLSVALGPNGIIEKARSSKLESRYSSIMDKIKLRETALEIAFAKNEEGESQENFVKRLIFENLITNNDSYDNLTYRTIYLGLQKDDTYKYTINVADGTLQGKIISDAINSLPNADTPRQRTL